MGMRIQGLCPCALCPPSRRRGGGEGGTPHHRGVPFVAQGCMGLAATAVAPSASSLPNTCLATRARLAGAPPHIGMRSDGWSEVEARPDLGL